MKLIILCSCIVLSGCAGLGDIEGLGKTGEVLRAIETIQGTQKNKDVTAVVNRTTGEINQLGDKHSVTSQVQSIKYIFENIR